MNVMRTGMSSEVSRAYIYEGAAESSQKPLTREVENSSRLPDLQLFKKNMMADFHELTSSGRRSFRSLSAFVAFGFVSNFSHRHPLIIVPELQK
jgi:hypothetical protein